MPWSEIREFLWNNIIISDTFLDPRLLHGIRYILNYDRWYSSQMQSQSGSGTQVQEYYQYYQDLTSLLLLVLSYYFRIMYYRNN